MPHAPRMTQPQAMKTKAYIRGVETLNGYDAWALFEACALGDLATVKVLLAKDRRLVNAQIGYRFPLHMAVFAGHAQIVKLLLDHGANPGESVYTYDSWDKLLLNSRERGYLSIESLLKRAMHKRFNYSPEFDALKEAIIARDVRQIGTVLRRQPDVVRSSDALGNNALHWSVITRQLGLIRRFIDLGTPVDAERADGQTPLLLAVNGATDYWYRDTRGRSHPSLRNTSVIVGSLLALGATYTISAAAAVGDQERVEQLLRTDADLAKCLHSAGGSPLSHAASEGHLHLVRLLLERGADPNLPEAGAPLGGALYAACCANHLPIAELLLEHGANPNAGVDSCESCLTIGRIYNGDRAKPLEKLLRQHGAYTPPYRMTVSELKQAIRDNHEVTRHDEFVDNVLEHGNPELLDLYLDSKPRGSECVELGIGPAHLSAASVRKLLDRGLDPNQTDWLGKTMLHVCAEKGNRTVAVVLLDHGADINPREAEFQGTPLAAAVRAWCGEADPKQVPSRRRMVEFFLKRGAASNLPGDKTWATPLSWATRFDRPEIVDLLKHHGAT